MLVNVESFSWISLKWVRLIRCLNFSNISKDTDSPMLLPRKWIKEIFWWILIQSPFCKYCRLFRTPYQNLLMVRWSLWSWKRYRALYAYTRTGTTRGRYNLRARKVWRWMVRRDKSTDRIVWDLPGKLCRTSLSLATVAWERKTRFSAPSSLKKYQTGQKWLIKNKLYSITLITLNVLYNHYVVFLFLSSTSWSIST